MTRVFLLISLFALSAHSSAATLTNLPGGPAWPSGFGAISTAAGYGTWQTWMGYAPDIVTVFLPFESQVSGCSETWEQLASAISRSSCNYYVADSGYGAMNLLPATTPIVIAVPMVPQGMSNRKCANGAVWDQMAAGAYDSYWSTFANNLKNLAIAHGRDPANHVLRLGWEMNGDWYAWSICNKQAAFGTAWPRVIKIIRRVIPGLMVDFSVSDPYVGFTAGRVYSGAGINLAGFLPDSSTYDFISLSTHDGNVDTVDDATWQQTHISPDGRRIGWMEVINTAKAVGKRIAASEWGVQMADCDSNWNTSPKPDFYLAKVHELFAANQDILAFETYFSPGCTALYNRQESQAAQTYKSLWSSANDKAAPTPPQLISVN